MPQNRNNVKHEQWDMCQRCGRFYPIGALTKQKGLLICTATSFCFDNLDVERRGFEINMLLGSGLNTEGTDMRQFDKGFFENFDETNT
jgi:hypothetical protein